MTEFHSSHIDFPRATFAKSAVDATIIICGLPTYQKIVNECLIDVPDSMFNMCLCAAAEIYKNGMIATAFDAALDLEEPRKRQNQKQKSRVVRREQIKVLKFHRAKIVSQLQEVGILPAGFGWLFVRWFVLPFLLELLKQWSIGPDELDEVQSETDNETWV
jgi:hypothetical protein